jgi:hypothetical protein
MSHEILEDGRHRFADADATSSSSPHGTAAMRLDNAAHLDHDFYRQALNAVHRLDEQQGRASGPHSENLAAALAVSSRHEGLEQIDHVLLSKDASHAYAVQGEVDSPLKKIAEVETSHAAATALQQSSEGWERFRRQCEEQQEKMERYRRFLEILGEVQTRRLQQQGQDFEQDAPQKHMSRG